MCSSDLMRIKRRQRAATRLIFENDKWLIIRFENGCSVKNEVTAETAGVKSNSLVVSHSGPCSHSRFLINEEADSLLVGMSAGFCSPAT